MKLLKNTTNPNSCCQSVPCMCHSTEEPLWLPLSLPVWYFLCLYVKMSVFLSSCPSSGCYFFPLGDIFSALAHSDGTLILSFPARHRENIPFLVDMLRYIYIYIYTYIYISKYVKAKHRSHWGEGLESHGLCTAKDRGVNVEPSGSGVDSGTVCWDVL